MELRVWRTSRRSGSNGQCVEVRAMNERIDVRDTKNRDGGQLSFSPEAWTAFIDATKIGAFDLI
jgi:hypothetical protein